MAGTNHNYIRRKQQATAAGQNCAGRIYAMHRSSNAAIINNCIVKFSSCGKISDDQVVISDDSLVSMEKQFIQQHYWHRNIRKSKRTSTSQSKSKLAAGGSLCKFTPLWPLFRLASSHEFFTQPVQSSPASLKADLVLPERWRDCPTISGNRIQKRPKMATYNPAAYNNPARSRTPSPPLSRMHHLQPKCLYPIIHEPAMKTFDHNTDKDAIVDKQSPCQNAEDDDESIPMSSPVNYDKFEADKIKDAVTSSDDDDDDKASSSRCKSPRSQHLYEAVASEFMRLGLAQGTKNMIADSHHCAAGPMEQHHLEQHDVNESTVQDPKGISNGDASSHSLSSTPPKFSATGCSTIGSRPCSEILNNFVDLSNDVLCVSHLAALVEEIERSVQKFTSCLIKAKHKQLVLSSPNIDLNIITKEDAMAELLRPTLLWRPQTSFSSPHDFKHGLQACISHTIFEHFGEDSYYAVNVSASEQNHGNCSAANCRDHIYRDGEMLMRQFRFLKQYYVLEFLIQRMRCDVEQLMEVDKAFEAFCGKKLEALKRRLQWVQRWPRKLLQELLSCLGHAWMVHKLAFSFLKPPTPFFVQPNTPFNPKYMSSLNSADSDYHCLHTGAATVQFCVFPGFDVEGQGTLRSTVYLQPRTQSAVTTCERCALKT